MQSPKSDKIADWLKWGRGELIESPSAFLDAMLLMRYASGNCLSKAAIMTARGETLPAQALDIYKALIERRKRSEPVAYILGRCEFMGLDFNVNPSVLIPRPDTELLAETAIEAARQAQLSILELCTGSGCVALSIAYYCPSATVEATDISPGALVVAEGNAAKLGLHVGWILSDMFENIPPRPYDMIVANPPYIAHKTIENLQPSVKAFEPITALDGGEDGLDFYKLIAAKSARYLKPGSSLMLEIGYDQAENVSALLKAHGFGQIEVKRDLAGLDRVITAKRG